MDRQEDILATLRSIEVLMAKTMAMQSVQLELARIQCMALPQVDQATMSSDLAKAMKRIERIGAKPSHPSAHR